MTPAKEAYNQKTCKIEKRFELKSTKFIELLF